MYRPTLQCFYMQSVCRPRSNSSGIQVNLQDGLVVLYWQISSTCSQDISHSQDSTIALI